MGKVKSVRVILIEGGNEMPENVTEHLIEHLKRHFVGNRVKQPLMTFIDQRNDLGIGNKIMARGEATITEFLSHDGIIEKESIFNGSAYRADLKLTFKYAGQTHGERWLYPGGVFVDNVWDSLHPTGEIKFHIRADQSSNWTVSITNMTFGAIHEDRPNRFVRDHVASKFINVITPLIPQALEQTPVPV